MVTVDTLDVDPYDFEFDPVFGSNIPPFGSGQVPTQSGDYTRLAKVSLNKPLEIIINPKTDIGYLNIGYREYTRNSGVFRFAGIEFNTINRHYWTRMWEGGNIPIIEEKLSTPVFPNGFSEIGIPVFINGTLVNKLYLPASFVHDSNTRPIIQVFKRKDWYWVQLVPYNVFGVEQTYATHASQIKYELIKRGETNILGSTECQFGGMSIMDGELVIDDKNLKSGCSIDNLTVTLPKVVELVILSENELYYRIWNEYYDMDGYKVRDPLDRPKRVITTLPAYSTHEDSYIFPGMEDRYYPIVLPLLTYIEEGIYLDNEDGKIILACYQGKNRGIFVSIEGYVTPTIIRTPMIIKGNLVFNDFSKPVYDAIIKRMNQK
ncbi:MAG: hypothetical protein ACYCQJ_14965 [Nitrososphaerales archaeon]